MTPSSTKVLMCSVDLLLAIYPLDLDNSSFKLHSAFGALRMRMTLHHPLMFFDLFPSLAADEDSISSTITAFVANAQRKNRPEDRQRVVLSICSGRSTGQ
jgi:hypothetical protein